MHLAVNSVVGPLRLVIRRAPKTLQQPEAEGMHGLTPDRKENIPLNMDGKIPKKLIPHSNPSALKLSLPSLKDHLRQSVLMLNMAHITVPSSLSL